MISLEESIGDTAEKFIQMKLKRKTCKKSMYHPDIQEGSSQGWLFIRSENGLYSYLIIQGSVGDESLIDKIEYMALMGL